MTPDEYRTSVLPQIISAWEQHCFCANPFFQKLLSFNFDDYGIGPIGLADTEILVSDLVMQRFDKDEQADEVNRDMSLGYRCPQCHAKCIEVYREFSISMNVCYALFDEPRVLADKASYLIGFFGFDLEDIGRIKDFQRTESVEGYLESLTKVS